VAGLVGGVKAVDDDLALGWIVEVFLDAVVARDAVALRDVERALLNTIPFGESRP